MFSTKVFSNYSGSFQEDSLMKKVTSIYKIGELRNNFFSFTDQCDQLNGH